MAGAKQRSVIIQVKVRRIHTINAEIWIWIVEQGKIKMCIWHSLALGISL